MTVNQLIKDLAAKVAEDPTNGERLVTVALDDDGHHGEVWSIMPGKLVPFPKSLPTFLREDDPEYNEREGSAAVLLSGI